MGLYRFSFLPGVPGGCLTWLSDINGTRIVGLGGYQMPHEYSVINSPVLLFNANAFPLCISDLGRIVGGVGQVNNLMQAFTVTPSGVFSLLPLPLTGNGVPLGVNHCGTIVGGQVVTHQLIGAPWYHSPRATVWSNREMDCY